MLNGDRAGGRPLSVVESISALRLSYILSTLLSAVNASKSTVHYGLTTSRGS